MNGADTPGTAGSIFFYPEQPPRWAMIDKIRRHLGITVAESPETVDWCMLWQNRTHLELAPDDPYRRQAWHWINGWCRDIAKETVERHVADCFGYPLAIDPLTHHGVALRKSNLNYVKDAIVVTCPVAEPVPGQVYERLVDTRIGDGFQRDMRMHIIGEHVSVWESTLEDWISEGRYRFDVKTSRPLPTEEALSPTELAQIRAFCRAIGLDVGSLDVLRDVADGRIYVIDANKTNSFDSWFIRKYPAHTKPHLREIAAAFLAQFPRQDQSSSGGLIA